MQLNNLFHEWLKSRKITDAVIDDFGIHGETEITIPILDHKGRFFFNKYRRSPVVNVGPKYWYDKGGSLTLYGLSKVEDSTEVMVTEGEMDCLVCWSHNISAVSSTGGALSFDRGWIDALRLKKCGITVCFDNDEAGGNGMAKIWEMDRDVRFVFVPDRPGIKDISDYVAGGGDLAELIKTGKKFADEESIRADRSERLALWKSTWFHDAVLLRLEESRKVEWPVAEKVRKLNGDRVGRAKQYPISELLKFNGNRSAKCLWHKESEASLHYYPEQNRTWCFGGCGKGYDAIDVYMQLNGCGFKEAVDKLQ